MHYSTYSSQCGTASTASLGHRGLSFEAAEGGGRSRTFSFVWKPVGGWSCTAAAALSPPTALIRLGGKYMFHISLPGSFSIPTSAGLSAGLLSGLSSLERPHFFLLYTK